MRQNKINELYNHDYLKTEKLKLQKLIHQCDNLTGECEYCSESFRCKKPNEPCDYHITI